MKTKHYLFGALAAMMMVTSCQEDAALMGNVGETATVSFQLETPAIATRAYSDGTTATVLQYAVYDENGVILPDLTKTDATINISTKVNLQLTTGNTYSVIFWAAAPNAPYAVNFDTKTMSVNYDAAVSNDENRDAFYKYHTFTVKGTQSETVELRRPFAQLNIGTSDYAASTTAGYTPTQSSVTVRNIYKSLNLATGAVDSATAVEYKLADIKRGEDYPFPVDGYEYIAMNYLLMDTDKELIDVEFTYTDGADAKTRTVGSVPVQRNHRTNIYGQLLTSSVDINVEIKPEYDEDDYEVSEFARNKEDIKNIIKEALKAGETNIAINALNANIGNLDYTFTAELVPSGVTVTLMNAFVEGRSYGNGVDGDVVFENCTFTNTGAYSIHFDNGAGNVTFKKCVLYGWNSFGSTLNTVNFYDSKLYGNGKYALIRSYVDLHTENCYFNTVNANHSDVYSEGVEVIGDATHTEVNCTYSATVDAIAADMQDGGEVTLDADIVVSTTSNIHTQDLAAELTVNGNGNTIVSFAESVDDFQWEGGSIPAMSTIFSSSNGSKVTVNDLSFSGTMSAVMLGHYVNSTYNNYNTELNNVNIVNTEVVSFSSNVAPALCVYGTATLNNCNVYGTTLSELDTDPMWPVYDIAAVNYSTTTLNNCKVGSFHMWNQAEVTIASGTVVESIIVRGNMNTSKYGLTIENGANVGVIDLSAITNKGRVNITIEAGATVGKVVANGVEYATLEEYLNA